MEIVERVDEKFDFEGLMKRYRKLRDFKELKYSKNKLKVEVNLDYVLSEL